MDNKQPKNDKDDSWKYLPDTDTLLEYLDKKDLIELSKCRKSYRNKLEQQVLENLNLDTWKSNNEDIYEELTKSCELENVLEFLKNDLGSKLIFVKKFALNCSINDSFEKIFVRLLPNIKSLFFYGCEHCTCSCCDLDCILGEYLKNSLKNMKYLEHVYYDAIDGYLDKYSPQIQIFPKSIKSIKIGYTNKGFYSDEDIFIYDTIDTSYVNLYSLTIITNRMLQSLSSGMPNLKEVEIKFIDNLDISKLATFLKANPQLKKLNIQYFAYSEEAFKTVLSYQYLERLGINNRSCQEIEAKSLPPNYSIKYLQINCSTPTSLNLKLINACKNLKTLELDIAKDFNCLDWSKLKQRINKLKLIYTGYTISDIIKEIDTSIPFDNIVIELSSYTREDISKIIDFKLNNYKLINSTSESCTLKLINKTY
jgi:hypothetical protein